MAQQANPTLRRRELGARLRKLRLQAGMSIADVSSPLMISAAKISRIETGARHTKLRDVRDLCRLYNVDGDELEDLMTLAKDAEEPSWWQQYDSDYAKFVGLEAAATRISNYKSEIVPGLLQTANYARAVLESTLPDPTRTQIDRFVDSRDKRRHRLSGKDPVRYQLVLDESALRRVVAGPGVMREQLKTLIDYAAKPNIQIQILGFEAGAHAAVTNNFMILNFNKVVSDVVYVEGLAGDYYVEKSEDVARYRRVFDSLRSRALNAGDSVGRISAIAATYGG